MIDQLIDWLIDWMNAWMNEWMNECMHAWMNEWTNEWTNERTNEWMNKKWISQSINQSNQWIIMISMIMNKWINEAMNQWTSEIADLIFQKCSETLSFLPRYSLVWIMPTESSKSTPNVTVCYDFMWPLDDDVVDIWNLSIATVSCAFSQPHLPKLLGTWQFFTFSFMWNQALATILCTFCQPHLPKGSDHRSGPDLRTRLLAHVRTRKQPPFLSLTCARARVGGVGWGGVG